MPVITTQDLPLDFIAELKQGKLIDVPRSPLSGVQNGWPVMSLLDCELHGIKTALKGCNGNISLAAKMGYYAYYAV